MPSHVKLWVSLLALAWSVVGQETYRPQYHFSPDRNWTNDPNGLVYFEGEYHLFFQYNPFGDKWGHMSWGHAVSRDLLHWMQLPVALPEENGVMIFTGSTVVDQQNSSGFCTGGKPCLVAIYTGHTPEQAGRKALQTQNLAYSNDRGRTWTKYQRNPVLDLHMSDFRDPKVLWSEASRQWVMAVALPDDHKVRMYGSPDLKAWTQLSDFGPAGATSGQWECPELFEAPVQSTGEKRWVMQVGLNPGALQGGSGEQYFVGRFDGTRFVNDNPPNATLWTDYGKDCYCALTFSNLPRTQPAVMIGWMDNWQYAADLPTSPWRGQMTVPRKLALRQVAGQWRLLQEPVDALKNLRSNPRVASGSGIQAANRQLSDLSLPAGHAYDLEASINLGSASTAGLRFTSQDGKAIRVGYDQAAKSLFFDRKNSSAVAFNKDFPADVRAPLTLDSGTLRLRLVADGDSMELFADDGQVAMTNLVFPAPGSQKLSLFADGGTLRAVSVKTWELRTKR